MYQNAAVPMALDPGFGVAAHDVAAALNAGCIVLGSRKPGRTACFPRSTAARVVRRARGTAHVLQRPI
jgi:hypothetical protein